MAMLSRGLQRAGEVALGDEHVADAVRGRHLHPAIALSACHVDGRPKSMLGLGQLAEIDQGQPQRACRLRMLWLRLQRLAIELDGLAHIAQVGQVGNVAQSLRLGQTSRLFSTVLPLALSLEGVFRREGIAAGQRGKRFRGCGSIFGGSGLGQLPGQIVDGHAKCCDLVGLQPSLAFKRGELLAGRGGRFEQLIYVGPNLKARQLGDFGEQSAGVVFPSALADGEAVPFE